MLGRRPGVRVVALIILIIVASLAVVLYTSHFGDFSETYDSSGAVVVLMFWFYLVDFVILLGTEINVTVNDVGRGAAASALDDVTTVSLLRC